MPTCTKESSTQRLLTSLVKRVSWLEKALAGFQEISGICTNAGNPITPVVAIELDPGTKKYTLTFLSTPNRFYQIQQSLDLVTWVEAEAYLAAADSPAISTEWESEAFADPVADPVFWRVRQYPTAIIPCAPPVPGGACPQIITT